MSEKRWFYTTVIRTRTYRDSFEAKSEREARKLAVDNATFDNDQYDYDEKVVVEEVKKYVE